MLNRCVIMGRFVRDPDMRRTQTGKAVVSFTLAVDRDFTNEDGERDADFIMCVAWGKTAEFVNSWFKKGSMAVASGRLQTRSYTDKEGNKRSVAEIVADSVYFGESKRSSESADYGKKNTPDFTEVEDDGELPF